MKALTETANEAVEAKTGSAASNAPVQADADNPETTISKEQGPESAGAEPEPDLEKIKVKLNRRPSFIVKPPAKANKKGFGLKSAKM